MSNELSLLEFIIILKHVGVIYYLLVILHPIIKMRKSVAADNWTATRNSPSFKLKNNSLRDPPDP